MANPSFQSLCTDIKWTGNVKLFPCDRQEIIRRSGCCGGHCRAKWEKVAGASHRISCSASTSNPITRERPRNGPRLHESINLRRCHFVFFFSLVTAKRVQALDLGQLLTSVLFFLLTTGPPKRSPPDMSQSQSLALLPSNGKSSSAPKSVVQCCPRKSLFTARVTHP